MEVEAYHCWDRCGLLPSSWAQARRQREWDWDSSEPTQEGELERGREGGRERGKEKRSERGRGKGKQNIEKNVEERTEGVHWRECEEREKNRKGMWSENGERTKEGKRKMNKTQGAKSI